jgi:hypothetical protein
MALLFVLAALPAVGQPPPPGALVMSGGPTGEWFVLDSGPFTTISAGPSTIAALRADGAVLYWNTFGGPFIDPGPFVDVIAGGPHATEDEVFAIRDDGSVASLMSPPTGAAPRGPFVEGAANLAGVILLRDDGSLDRWGICAPCVSLPAGPFAGIASGGTVAIATRSDGTLEMWGPNFFGLPSPPPGQFSAVSIEYINSRYVLGLRPDGSIVVWAGSSTVPPPTAPPPGQYKAIDASVDFLFQPWAIAVRADGTLVVWGSAPGNIANVPPGKYTDVETGYGRALALAGCYADCSDDAALTVADFGCFQTKFVAGDPYADCNADGALTVADFGCFQTGFVAGCP